MDLLVVGWKLDHSQEDQAITEILSYKYEGGYTNIIYNMRVLQSCFSPTHSNDSIIRMICRSIEHNLECPLIWLLDKIKEYNMDIPDKRLYLRWCRSINCYILASRAGFHDEQLDHAIIRLQQLVRTKSIPKQNIIKVYNVPTILDFYRENRYYGYRMAMHFLRWNRTKAYQLYRDILSLGQWGNCEWQSYIEFLNEDDKADHLRK